MNIIEKRGRLKYALNYLKSVGRLHRDKKYEFCAHCLGKILLKNESVLFVSEDEDTHWWFYHPKCAHVFEDLIVLRERNL